MPDTARKVEIVAAALYASSFVIWTLSDSYLLSPTMYENQTPAVSELGWQAVSLVLLLFAVALTVAAVHLRRSS
jgi:small-conductance mechanosensitive channel